MWEDHLIPIVCHNSVDFLCSKNVWFARLHNCRAVPIASGVWTVCGCGLISPQYYHYTLRDVAIISSTTQVYIFASLKTKTGIQLATIVYNVLYTLNVALVGGIDEA